MLSGSKYLLVGLCCAAAGLAAGVLIDRWAIDVREATTDRPMREGGVLLINPLLECEGTRASAGNATLRNFENSITKFVKQTRESMNLRSLSVYFRELNDGLWFEIGDVEHYAPVSLLKLPLMIAVLKQAEQSPSLLKRKVLYDSPVDLNEMQTFKSPEPLRRGKSYTVEELVRRMIVHSDNNAFSMLEGIIDPQTYRKLYRDLGIPMASIDRQDYTISAKEFATFLRVLYNASYLGREMSEDAMELLAQASFRQGIEAGVPPDVTVAHKFGEGSWEGGPELHDCGIVYYPEHPYLLCVMSSGRDIEDLHSALGAVSRAVYTEVAKQQIPAH